MASSAVVSSKPSAAAAASQSASVVIEPAPLASQLAPDVKLVNEAAANVGASARITARTDAAIDECSRRVAEREEVSWMRALGTSYQGTLKVRSREVEPSSASPESAAPRRTPPVYGNLILAHAPLS